MPIFSTFKKFLFFITCLVFPTVFTSITIAQENVIPITIENSSELQLLATIENYRDAGYCACDVRFYSPNGRAIATDQKILDLETGTTIDLSDRGYPLAFNPQGTHILISGENNGTRLIDIVSGAGQVLMTDDAEEAVFSPDGKLIVTASLDADAVQVWRVDDLSLMTTLGRASTIDYIPLQFIQDGNYLLWNDDNGNLHLWNLQHQDEDWVVASGVSDYKLTSDESTIILNQYSDTIEVWDIEDRNLVATVVDTHDQSGVDTYALSPDKQRLVISYYGGNDRLEIWDISVDPHQQITEIDERYGYALWFTDDSQYLIYSGGRSKKICYRETSSCGGSSGGWSDDIRMVDLSSGEIVSTVESPQQIQGIDYTVLTSDGTMLITAGRYGSGVDLWKVDGTDITHIIRYPGIGFLLSPDESTLLVQLNSDFLAVYGIPSASRPIQQYALPGEIHPSSVNVRAEPNIDATVVGTASGIVHVLGQSPDGDYVYLSDYEGWIRAEQTYIQLVLDLPVADLPIIDPDEPALIPTMPPSTATPMPTTTPIVEVPDMLDTLQLSVDTPIIPLTSSAINEPIITSDTVDDLALLAVLPESFIRQEGFPLLIPSISSDGSYLITPPIDTEQYPRIWDLTTFEYEIGPDMGTSDYSRIMVGSPQGGYIVYTEDDFSYPLKLWSLDSKEICVIYNGYLFGRSITFSPDGQLFAYPGGVSGVSTTAIQFTIDNSGDKVFSPDSQYLAVITRDRAYIYDIQTGELLSRTTRMDGNDYLEDGIFSPDNSRLATTTSEGIFVYDVKTGELLFNAPYQNYSDNWEIEGISFSPDAKYLLALNPKGILYVWDAYDGTSIGTYDTQGAKGIAFSPDGQMLAISNPLRFIDLNSGGIMTVEGNYGGNFMSFSPDGTSLLIDSADSYYYEEIQSVMVFGIPTDNRPVWQSVSASVRPSSINVWQEPEGESAVVGTASGNVNVLARDETGTAVYIAEPAGWVWSAPEYIILEESALNALPVRSSQIISE